MCDNEFGDQCGDPVYQIFFHPQNIAQILAAIQQRTGLLPAQVGPPEFLKISYMLPLFTAAQGVGMREPQWIFQHVGELNARVVDWASKDAVIGNAFNDNFLRLQTGTNPLIDRGVFDVDYGELRKTSALYPTYTQFYS